LKTLITGATGFIGKALVEEGSRAGLIVSVAVRQKTDIFYDKIKQVVLGDFEKIPDFSLALKGIDCVVHLSGKAHIMDKKKASTLDDYRRINVELTLALAKQAIEHGVKRFIFLSSIGVHGNENCVPFLETDVPNPIGSYSISKHEAEIGLLSLAKYSNLEVVIIRPPLVYGKGAPGNFGKLVRWASAEFTLPLPLGAVNNTRSLIAIDNLVSFVLVCIKHPKSANEIFLVSDDDDLSTTQFFGCVSEIFNGKVLLFPFPVVWMSFVAKLLGKESYSIRLFSSLTVDSSKARDLLGWRPVTTMVKQLKNSLNEE